MTDEPDEQGAEGLHPSCSLAPASLRGTPRICRFAGTVSFNLAPPERSARFDSLEDVFPSGDGAGPGDEAAADLPTFTTLDDVVHW